MEFTQSLKKNYEFRIVYKRGKSVADKYLVLYMYPNSLNMNRLGVTVSKKVGNAVVRNRVTRLIRENYRLCEKDIKTGMDIVFVARRSAADADFHVIRKSLINCLSNCLLINSRG